MVAMVDPTRPDLIDVAATMHAGHADRDAIVRAAFEAHHTELFTFLLRSTRDAAAAEDLLQDTFLRLTREIDAGRTPEQLRAWLYRVAANLAISRVRRARTALNWLRQQQAGPLTDHVRSPEASVIDHERSAEIEAALATLDPDARTAMLLSADGFSGMEIAATIGRSHAATRTMLSRARLRVRAELERQGAER
jgi:RNA polymerase sigma-70 factor (ECF subfamily)